MNVSEFIKFRKIIKKNKILPASYHNHTTASDGEMEIATLLFLNLLYGFKEVAITDHNAIAWNENRFYNKILSKICAIFHTKVISGIEFSCFFEINDEKHEFHITGLGINPDDKKINEAAEKIQTARKEMIEKIIQRINKLGYSIISFEELKKKSRGNITVPDIAKNVRMKDGKKVDVQNFIDDHLVSGKDCYFSNNTFLLPVKEAIDIIKSSGGTAVWAHPKYTLKNLFDNNFDNIALQLKNFGIEGIEAFRGGQNAEDTERIKNFCERNKLKIIGGPDTHKAKDLLIYAETIMNLSKDN